MGDDPNATQYGNGSPKQPYFVQPVKPTLAERLVVWGFAQGPSTVLLFALVAIVWSLGSWMVQVGIPIHLKQIQAGYEQLDERHNAERKAWRETVAAENQAIRELTTEIRELRIERAQRAGVSGS